MFVFKNEFVLFIQEERFIQEVYTVVDRTLIVLVYSNVYSESFHR